MNQSWSGKGELTPDYTRDCTSVTIFCKKSKQRAPRQPTRFGADDYAINSFTKPELSP